MPAFLLPHRALTTLALAGALGASAVGLGAFGAHALAGILAARGTASTWQTAVFYHALHAAVLLALAGLQALAPEARALTWASGSFVVGVVLFSGSLYLLALGGSRALGPVTPLGGLFLLGGWGCILAVGLLRR